MNVYAGEAIELWLGVDLRLGSRRLFRSLGCKSAIVQSNCLPVFDDMERDQSNDRRCKEFVQGEAVGRWGWITRRLLLRVSLRGPRIAASLLTSLGCSCRRGMVRGSGSMRSARAHGRADQIDSLDSSRVFAWNVLVGQCDMDEGER